MARFDRYTVPSVFNVLSADYFVGTTADITNVSLTTVSTLSVLNSPIVGLGVVGINYVHTNSLTAVTLTASEVIYAQGGNSLLWNAAYNAVTSLSASWEESADILPTVTNYLSTELVTVSSLNVSEQMLSASIDLFNIFLTPNNTLTTSICAISGDGIAPFIMQFTNGLLTGLTV